MRIKRFNWEENLTLFGMSLSLIGVTYGMYTNFFLGGIEWSPVFMLISFLLIISYKNIFKLKFPSYSKVYGLLVFFQLLMLLYGAFSNRMTFQLMSFHLYIIALIIAYSSLPTKEYYNKLPGTIFYISMPAIILGVFVTLNDLVVSEEVFLLKQIVDIYVLEPFTVLQAAFINGIAGLCMNRETQKRKILFIIFLCLDVYILLSYDKRTPVFVFILSVIFYFYIKGKIHFNRKFIRNIVLFFCGILLIYTQVEFVETRVDAFFDNFYRGVLNLVGDTSVHDHGGSAIMRYYLRRTAFNDMNANFSAFNWIFGGGYMRAFIDAPILQAYIDMGIVGFLFYVFFIVIYPIKVLKRTSYSNALLFAFLCSIQTLSSLISAGHIYGYGQYTFFCLLAFMSINFLKKKRRGTFYIRRNNNCGLSY